MARMIALKKLRYPNGAGGKEYMPGDQFETLSERDTKALSLVQVARLDDSKAETSRRKYRRRDVVAED